MYIASVSTTIKFHDFPNGNVVHNYQPGKVEGPVRSVSWSRDGNWLVVVPHSGQTEIVGTKDQLRLLKTIQEIDEPTAASFQNTTKKNVGIGTKSGLVLIYDVKSRNVKKRFPRASTQITHVAFTAKDGHCVAGCKNGDVLVYNNVTNSPPTNLRVPKSNSITCIKTNQTKKNLVLGGSNEGIVVIWDININRSKFCTEAHKAPVNAVSISPVNTDLIVTAGADRQFCFYDIADNKCIANVAVENSITSVDFSPDGTNFVMGSQNGRVYVYDSRNIQQPVHSFLAHNAAVRHIAFQKICETDSSSSSNISKPENVPIAQEEKKSRRSVRTSDFFGIHVHTVDAAADPKTVPSLDAGDSFIAALGLDKNNTIESINEDVFIKNGSRLQSVNDVEEPPSCSVILNKLEPKQFSSTPKLGFQNLAEVSPKMFKSPNLTSDVEQTRKMIKDCFAEQFEPIMQELMRDMQQHHAHLSYQMKTMLLSMHASFFREFIKLENANNKLREEMLLNDENHLVEENKRLRKQVEYWEDLERQRNAQKENKE